jgi:hypothetical protein
VPLRDAIARGVASGSTGFISPLDLVEIGLMTAEEAKDLHAQRLAARIRATCSARRRCPGGPALRIGEAAFGEAQAWDASIGSRRAREYALE